MRSHASIKEYKSGLDNDYWEELIYNKMKSEGRPKGRLNTRN